MEKAKILERLIKESGYNLKSFASKCGIPYTTLYGIIRNGVGKASVDNIIIICKNIGITIDELENMANGSNTSIGTTYEDVEKIISRNSSSMTSEQRMKLIQLLSDIKG